MTALGLQPELDQVARERHLRSLVVLDEQKLGIPHRQPEGALRHGFGRITPGWNRSATTPIIAAEAVPPRTTRAAGQCQHALMDHLALAVRDQQRSRQFYETYLGFDARPSRRYPDGTLMLYNARGFALALGHVDEPIRLPPFLHFGNGLQTPATSKPSASACSPTGSRSSAGGRSPST